MELAWETDRQFGRVAQQQWIVKGTEKVVERGTWKIIYVSIASSITT